MRVAGHILVFFYFITFQLSAQEIQNKLSPFDSTKQTINYPQEKMQFKNIFRNKIHKGMNQTDISNLKLYNETIDSTLSFQNFMLSYDEIITDSTEDFKKSFSLLMEYAKHNQNKYDLGEFGRYLGISRDILAIILALISVAK